MTIFGNTRRGRTLTKARTAPTLSVVVLAAGFSTRLGRPKALATVRGVSLLRRTLALVAPFATQRLIVVAPPRQARYRVGVPANTALFVPNPARAAGLSTSVRLGLHHGRHAAGVLLLPVDLAGLAAPDLARLVSRWRAGRRRVAARRIGGGAGTPLILPRWLQPRAGAIIGDQGLRSFIDRLADEHVVRVSIPSAEADVDTPRDLERVRRSR